MPAVEGFDPSRPNIARVYDYWLGGKDNFAADRELAQKMCEINPGVPAMIRDNPGIRDPGGDQGSRKRHRSVSRPRGRAADPAVTG